MKVVLHGYYKGIMSSRGLAEAFRRNVVFMALSADSQPHFATIVAFVSELDREIVGLFRGKNGPSATRAELLSDCRDETSSEDRSKRDLVSWECPAAAS